MTNHFHIDPTQPTTPFPHYWEQCVGSGHASMGLRQDWREQLKKAHDELGFQYVRFHGLLNDDMSVYVQKMLSNEHYYSFFNIDLIFDFLLEIGMKPFIELSFMPTPLASGTKTVFHYKGNITPPKDYTQWEELIERLTRHLVERYGLDEVRQWFFEVWNEPNLQFFWAGTQEEYFKLYQHAAAAVKRVDARLRVGGPATSINAWLPEMIHFCESTGTPLDFLSTHHYPTDDPLWRRDDLTIEEFFRDFASEMGKYQRGVLYEMTSKAKAQAGDYPLYYTEWNTSARHGEPHHDEPYAAALVAKTIVDNSGLVEGYSFWTFSDLFEEGGQLPGTFHGGFGLQTNHGIAKPTYRLYQLLHALGTERLAVETEADSTVEMVATHAEGSLNMLVYNHNTMDGEIKAETVRLHLKGVTPLHAEMVIIDADHANPKQKWVELGSPEYPTPAQLAEIETASHLITEECPFEIQGDNCEIEFTIQPHGVVAVTLTI